MKVTNDDLSNSNKYNNLFHWELMTNCWSKNLEDQNNGVKDLVHLQNNTKIVLLNVISD